MDENDNDKRPSEMVQSIYEISTFHPHKLVEVFVQNTFGNPNAAFVLAQNLLTNMNFACGDAPARRQIVYGTIELVFKSRFDLSVRFFRANSRYRSAVSLFGLSKLEFVMISTFILPTQAKCVLAYFLKGGHFTGTFDATHDLFEARWFRLNDYLRVYASKSGACRLFCLSILQAIVYEILLLCEDSEKFVETIENFIRILFKRYSQLSAFKNILESVLIDTRKYYESQKSRNSRKDEERGNDWSAIKQIFFQSRQKPLFWK